MASPESDQVTDEDAARQAAEVAVELTEAEGPEDRRRLMRSLNNVARSAGRAVGRGERPDTGRRERCGKRQPAQKGDPECPAQPQRRRQLPFVWRRGVGVCLRGDHPRSVAGSRA